MTITWHPHTDIPTTPETAIIAVSPLDDESGHPEPLLLPELHRFDVRMGIWLGEVGGLVLRCKEYRWAKESDVLETLPTCAPQPADIPSVFIGAEGRN